MSDRRLDDRRQGRRRGTGRRRADWNLAGAHHDFRHLEARGTETILVVDDEDLVRGVVRSILKSHGYTVLQAASGTEALDRIAQYSHPIHLVMTDVVMPGMNGRELADRLALFRPHLKILYMSGNPMDILPPGIELISSSTYIQKPFTIETLLMKVRDVLDRSGPG